MPLPPGVTAAQLFTLQPGGAVPSTPLPIMFPNPQNAPPGSTADLYFFDIAAGDWRVWGTGTVSPDGKQIVSDPGFGLPRFAWHFAFTPTSLSDQVRSRNAQGGEPVDLVTGRFTMNKTDLVLAGRLPVTIQRSYRSENPQPGLFGIGWNLAPYDTRLTTAGTSLSLILPDQSTYLLTPSGPGQWTNTTEPFLRGAVLTQLPGDFIFQLRFKNGTVQRFDRILGFANLAALSQITDRNGNTVTLTREQVFQQNKITQIIEPAGRKLTLAYDTAGRITAITDPLGRQVQYAYDALGRLTSVTDPAGGVTRYTYDPNHRILTITDPQGITFLSNEYDAAGRVIRQTQADGGVFTFAYTVTGNLVTATMVTDPRGNPTTHRFSSQGFTLSTTDALGQTTSFTYTTENLLAATTDPLGRVTRFAYDNQGNVTSITDPTGNIRSFTYEPTLSRVTSIRDPLGNTTSFEYDGRGNLTATVDPLGSRTTIAYNTAGQPTATTDPVGNTTTFGYDASGNLATVADPLGNTTTRSYDAASRLTGQTDPRGKPTNFSYDPLNRITSITDALGGVTRFGYDTNGNLLTVTDARGNSITHTYDPMDRLATRVDQVGASEAFAYHPARNLTRHTDRKGQVASFTYDGLNRRTAASYADGTSTSFSYDAAGRLTVASDSAGGTIQNGYDTLDRLVAQATGLGTVSYQYDALGRRTSMLAPGQAPVTYGYDAASRLTAITQGAQLVALNYDAAGRRTRLTLPNGVSTEYQYDPASRLTALIYRTAAGPLGALSYQYDAAGNRIAVGGSFARTLLPDAVTTASYDAANRQNVFGDKQMAFDANGSLISITEPSGPKTFAWDARNQLVGLQEGTTTAAFAYDASGRRVAKRINDAITQYAYDGLDITQQVDGQGASNYLRSLVIDEALGVGTPTGNFFLLADGLGSTLAGTGGAGGIATEYRYDPFGTTASTDPTVPNPFQFTGRENDGLAGLYYYRARYYHPTLARFISEDLLGTAPYRYARNNPLSFLDPLGLREINILGGFGFSALLDRFGGEASAGVGLVITLNSITDISVRLKGFTSTGRPGGGFNFSGDVFGGITLDELAGPTTNLNLSVGPISVTTFSDPEVGFLRGFKGFTVGGGPTLPCPPCIGVSVTNSNTETIDLAGPIGIPDRATSVGTLQRPPKKQ